MSTTRRQLLTGSLGSLAFLAAGFGQRNASAAARKPRKLSDFDPQVRQLLAQLSLDQKIGQMTQPDQTFLQSLDDIEKYHLGSLLSGGDSDPKSGNDLNSWTDLYDGYQSRALKMTPRIPLLYGIDAVHGNNNVIGATLFPHNIGLGCTRNAALIERAARITAEEVRATGINWGFAPCVAVPQDIRWGRIYEGFSESPDLVKTLGAAALRGLQYEGLDNPLSVLGCPKHFIGDGGTTFGTGLPRMGKTRYGLDQGDTQVDEATLRKIHLPGYITTLQAGAASIMPSYSSWNGVKCSASHRLLTEILKTELGFDGFLISDYAALQELPGEYKQQIATSINAGMDMVMIPEHYPEFFNLLRELVNEGTVPQSRIDDAVTRILRVKFAMGLMDPKRSQLADRGLHKSFGSAEHRAVARQCVSESLVVVKNDNNVLPLKPAARIHVAGKSADNIGNQCGGCDRTDLHLSKADVAVVDQLKSAGLPVVVILISGRPMIIDDILSKADAVVAAWLPGAEGDGVTDVLFGSHKPMGKLSFTWPAASSTSMHIGDPGYHALYPYGHGLSW
ncbi:MAG: glycoside hydrolase family 3 protein [Bryobacteraceae bacterium]